jgi:cell division protein FtsB
MLNINTRTIQKFIYHLKHRYLTANNVIIAVAFLIAASWVWGSLDMMQRNYSLQRELDQKAKSLQLTQLQRDNLALEKKYYETSEYQELEARESLGLVRPGEKALLLPPNTVSDETSRDTRIAARPEASNLEQWMNFLFGGYSRSIERS